MKTNEIQHIVAEAEEQLTQLVGHKVIISLSFDNVEERVRSMEPLQRSYLLHKLKEITCKEFNVRAHELLQSRVHQVSDARGAYCFIAFKIFHANVYESSAAINRDRTTVAHLLKRIQNLIDVNDPIKYRMKRIEDQILNQLVTI